jgi:hypothetical protein
MFDDTATPELTRLDLPELDRTGGRCECERGEPPADRV